MTTPTDEELLGRAVRLARSHSKRLGQKHPRWVAVMEAFVVGSTSGKELCVRFGLDPEEEVFR